MSASRSSSPARLWFRPLEILRKWFSSGPSKAERHLLRRCLGDLEKVERLIAYEVERRPHPSRASAAKAALRRWARDS